ncbi:MAG: ferrous iron transporter B [Firmicutes bacterium]|nr:ferrous iron transporter B [Bacillota bacterium]
MNQEERARVFTVALAGNPNVGKSTVFNALTGLRQHTGNWSGKTVRCAEGHFTYHDRVYRVIDLPGCYSLEACSEEEREARALLLSGRADAAVVVCDATCLERNLILALQIKELLQPVVLCVNMLDEAQSRGIEVDLAELERQLGLPVVGISARRRGGAKPLLPLLEQVRLRAEKEAADKEPQTPADSGQRAVELARESRRICRSAVRSSASARARDRKIDRWLTGPLAFPFLLLLLVLIFWLTVSGANYPSALLSALAQRAESWLYTALLSLGAPEVLCDALTRGVFRVLAWVVSVMLPPMAIFFPLFTLLEDAGFLPRVAYDLDRCFRGCCACGKQALTVCMGYGCNAVGVSGCRIIDSPRERLVAILTNSVTPCNGRFPALIAVMTMFFLGGAAGAGASFGAAAGLAALIVFSMMMTLLLSKLLSATVLSGLPSSFTLELPPFRRPEFCRVILRSVLDRTLFVLGRAAAVAAPAGLVIWLLANTESGGLSLLAHFAAFLDPFARLLGLDGVILLAFILGLPANEIVIPVMIMAYMAGEGLTELPLSALHQLLLAQGWTWATAVSFLVFSLMHWPCSTTIITIYKETRSLKWTALAVALPAVAGVTVCMLFTFIVRLLGF